MRNLILNLHLYGALIAGLFLIMLGVTGSLLAFQEDLDHLFNPHLFKIVPQSDVLPLSAIQDSLQKTYPDKKFTVFSFPQEPDKPYVARWHSTEIFVNSYTGAVIGSRETPTLLTNIRSMHTSLWLGKTGRNLVGIATGFSVFLIVTGIYLWWPVRNTGTTRGLSFYLHYALGLYFSLFLLLLSLTGLVMTFDWAIGPWAFRVTQSTPPRWDVPSTVVPGATPLTATTAVDIASKRLMGAQPVTVSLPSKPQGSYAINLQYPGDSHENRVIVDQYSGAILSAVDSRAFPGGLKIMSINGGIHTGTIFGLPSQIVMSAASLILAVQTITGYCLWWKKLRRKPQTPS